MAVVSLLPVPVTGQSRGSGPRFVGSPTRSRVADRGHAPIVGLAPLVADGFRPAILVDNLRRGVRYVPRSMAISQFFGFYSPFLMPSPYPRPVYPVPMPYRPSTYYPAYSDTAPVYAEMLQQLTESQRAVNLAYQIGRLTQQVNQLRQEQALKQSQEIPRGDQEAVETPAIPTILIFRDGQRREIQNYAVVGQTLWILDETYATPIALSDLNIDAMRTENERRGVRFLPAR